MPNITIREVDTSTAGAIDYTTNAAYVPGYALTGPVNEPVLCESLSYFQQVFGTVPYTYVQGVEGTGLVPSVQPGDYETSYIYASDLLRLGLPVLFERVAPKLEGDDEADWKATGIIEWTKYTPQYAWQENTDVTITCAGTAEEPQDPAVGDYWYNTDTEQLKVFALVETVGTWVDDARPFTYGETAPENPSVGDWWYNSDAGELNAYEVSGTVETNADLNLKAIDPGSASGTITFTIETLERTYGDLKTGTYYRLNVYRVADAELGITETSPVSTQFSFNKELCDEYTQIKYYNTLEQDASGMVELTFDADIAAFMTLTADETVAITTPTGVAGRLTLDSKYAGKNEFIPANLYAKFTALPSMFEKLEDKGDYVIKFITSGGYPVIDDALNTSIAYTMLSVANKRGDVTSIIDYKPTLTAQQAHNAIEAWATTLGNQNGEPLCNYGAVFTPWCVFNSPTARKQLILAPSFAYLSAYANSVQTNVNYYAIAGTDRGIIPNMVKPLEKISNSLSNELQPRTHGISINPIVDVKPYGIRIWGNRTLKDNTLQQELTATSFLNIRQLSSDVKRVTWIACKRCTFEQNSDALWISFRSLITPTLDRMVGNNGLSDYQITRLPTDKKATIVARITLYAVEPVEDFDITLELTDSQITIVQ